MADQQGQYTGLDVDVCRAIAAAVLGDAEQGQVHAGHGAAALHPAAIGRGRCAHAQHDLDLPRDTELGLNFAPVNYYDGQGFMVAKKPA